MPKILSFLREASRALAPRMVDIIHKTCPQKPFLSTQYLESLGMNTNPDICAKFNGLDFCHHASELLFYLFQKSNPNLNLQFINFQRQRHCFLTSEDGATIIDPTWKQFLSPDEFYRSVISVHQNSQHHLRCMKFYDYDKADKGAIKNAELELMKEDIIFVGTQEEIDEKLAHFIERFNQAYDVSDADLMKKF